MNDFIKKPNVQDEYTPDQIQELVRCSDDIVYFCKNYIKVQHPKRGAISFDPYQYQERMLKAFQENQFTIVLAGRQLGKSTIIAMYLLWYGMFNSDKTILVASNKNSNAMEIMHRIKYAYEELPMWLKPGVTYYTKHSMEFDNGSKIISQATTANTGRGMSCVSGDSMIRIRHKKTGHIYDISMSDFALMINETRDTGREIDVIIG